jgi:P27 family predicted phage terminase small subunit
VTTLDEALLASYCATYATFIEVSQAIEQEGLTVKSPKHGAIVKHPLMTILNQSRVALLKFAGELGLTPAGRDRLDWRVGPIEDNTA